MRRLASALALVLLALPAAAGTIVVLPIEAPGEPENSTVAAAASDLLEAALSAAGLTLVEREALEKVLREHDLRGRLGDEGVLRAGKLLAADRAVTGTISRARGGWRISLRLLAVPSGQDLGGTGSKAALAGLGEAMEMAAVRLAELAADSKPAADLREELHALASLHYLRGLGFHRAGLHLEAIGELLEAKRLAVRFPETRFWMARSYLRVDEPEHARIEAGAFLEAAPEHALAARARELLARAEAAARELQLSPPPRDRLEALVEKLAGPPDPTAKREALAALIEMGEKAVPHLVRLVTAGESPALVLESLEALAALDEEAFIDAAFDAPQLLRGALWERFRAKLTAERAGRTAERLLSPSPPERAGAVRSLGFCTPRLPEAPREAILEVAVRAARSRDPQIALPAIELLFSIGRDLVVDLVAERVRDDTLPPAHRAEVLRSFLQASIPYVDRLDAVLAPLLDSRSPLLQEQVIHGLRGSPDSRVRGRAHLRALEEVRDWAHAETAVRYAQRLIDWRTVEGARNLAERYLRSEDGARRQAGFHILRRLSPEDATRRAFELLLDPEDQVKAWAVLHIGEHAPAREGLRRLLEHWEILFPPDDPLSHTHPARTPYLTALGRLARRDLSEGLPGGGNVPSPRLEDGREAWEGWLVFWRARVKRLRGLVKAFKEADAADRPGLLEAVGRAGHPFVLRSLTQSLTGQEQRDLKPAIHRAILALARTEGLPETGMPPEDAGDAAFLRLLNRVTDHLTRNPVWNR